ncbi:MAG: hypothetical protein GXP28_10940 [Planctomycetes bacterium]|nr:hypothetical protein [Planctomycetota bacterium]
MNRVITWTAALMMLVAAFAVVGQSQAEAGLFNRNKCCKPAKKCRTPRRSKNECCQPAPCCEAAPACIEATPACGGCSAAIATPACGGCETQLASCDSCNTCCPSRREQRKARKNCCVQTCGCEAQGCNSCGSAQIIQGCSSCGGQAIQGAVIQGAVEGCTNCGGAAVEAPTPAIEAAPEAPEGDSTT